MFLSSNCHFANFVSYLRIFLQLPSLTQYNHISHLERQRRTQLIPSYSETEANKYSSLVCLTREDPGKSSQELFYQVELVYSRRWAACLSLGISTYV